MVKWLRINLGWEVAVAIVGVLAGILGATLLSIEQYTLAELCFGLSGLTLALWAFSVRWHWVAKCLLVAIIGACSIFLIYLMNEFRIQKEADASKQNHQFEVSQRTQIDVATIKQLLLENQGKTDPSPDQRTRTAIYYCIRTVLFRWSQDSLYYGRPNSVGVDFEPANIKVEHINNYEICLSGFKISVYGTVVRRYVLVP